MRRCVLDINHVVEAHEFQQSPYGTCRRDDDKASAKGHGFVVRAHERLRSRRVHEFEGAEIEGKLAVLSVERTSDCAPVAEQAAENAASWPRSPVGRPRPVNQTERRR